MVNQEPKKQISRFLEQTIIETLARSKGIYKQIRKASHYNIDIEPLDEIFKNDLMFVQKMYESWELVQKADPEDHEYLHGLMQPIRIEMEAMHENLEKLKYSRHANVIRLFPNKR